MGWRAGVEQFGGQALTASPISSSRIRIASKIRPSDRSPRCRWERIASIAARMSASLCRSAREDTWRRPLELQRGRLTPRCLHFGGVTSRTRHQPAYGDPLLALDTEGNQMRANTAHRAVTGAVPLPALGRADRSRTRSQERTAPEADRAEPQ